jgi:hypothetical protein
MTDFIYEICHSTYETKRLPTHWAKPHLINDLTAPALAGPLLALKRANFTGRHT